jgi:ATP-dependent RNA helicase DeaD
MARTPLAPGRGENMTRIFIGAGRQAGVRPADVVGAIAGEAGITSRELGTIEIADRFALIEVPEERADDIVEAMNKATLRGQKVQVRRDRDGPRRSTKKSGRTT